MIDNEMIDNTWQTHVALFTFLAAYAAFTLFAFGSWKSRESAFGSFARFSLDSRQVDHVNDDVIKSDVGLATNISAIG
jgi:hypothetical protein